MRNLALSSNDPVGLATTRQDRASDPAHSAWVDASAGSGKTKVLIDRVLRLLLAGVPAQKILCLTFTKAAAANMALRLTGELGNWATLPEGKLATTLKKLTGKDPDDEAISAARRLFAATLDAPGGLQFQTIHSFCQSLLARFPLEAGIPVGFTVLEDRQSQSLLSAARRELLDGASHQPGSDLALALNVLLETYTGTGFANLEREIVQQRSVLETQLQAGHGPALAALGPLLGLEDGETTDSVTAQFCRDEAHNMAGLRQLAAAMIADGGKNNVAYGTPLSNWLARDETGRLITLDDFLTAFLTGEGKPRADVATKNLVKANPGFDTIIAHEREVVARLQAKLKATRTATTSRALIIYAAALLGRYHQLKTRMLALDFDDLITAASTLVTHERASWVLYKLDGGIDHVLVDEAQDTNGRQWQLIEALTTDFFSGEGSRNAVPPRSVFAVGDYKQSIYSFQGADPDAFTQARTRLGHRISLVGSRLESVDFSVSFRSNSAVLSAVDRVFMETGAGIGLPGYAEHQSSLPALPGQVDVWPVAPPDPKDGPRIRPLIKVAHTLAAQIKQWVEGKEPLAARGRPMEYGDFLVLVRSRGAFMPEFVRACKQLGVPVSGADRMIIDEQLAVEDLLAFAAFLLLPEDDLTLATVLKGPFIGMSEEALFALAHGRDKASLISRLGRDSEGHKYAAWLASWQRRTDRMTPYTLLSALLAEPCPCDARSGRRAIVARLGPEANDPLDELLSLALQYEQGETPSLQGFLRWIKSGKTEIKRELEQAAGQVRIMTAHGSKGLEAPIVIVADSLSPPRDRANLLTDPDGVAPPLLAPSRSDEAECAAARRTNRSQRLIEEYHRLLYVALTRAEDRLIFAAWSNQNTKIDAEGRLESAPSEPGWYHLLLQGLQKATAHEYDLTALGGWKGMGLLHRLGDETQQRSHKAQAGLQIAAMAALPDWALRLPPDEPSPTRPLTPSKLADEPAALSPLADDDGWRFRRGLLIHRLLQTLPDLPAPQRRSAGLRWLGQQAKNPGQLIDEVLAVINAPEATVLFGPHSRAEVPISGQVGARTLSGQIDRLAITDNTVWVVDFKTNRTPPATVEAVDKAYLRQLAAYRAALAPLYPGHAIRAILLWTDGPGLMEIPTELLDMHAP